MARKIIPVPGEDLQFIFEGSLVQIKTSVATYNDLPITGNTENDLRITQDTDRMYTWSIASASGNLSDWTDIGQSISLDWSAITGKPTSSVADIDDAVAKKHTQGTDQKLDNGGPNEVAVVDVKDAVDKKHAQNTDVGTNSETFAIEDIKIKNESGTLAARNNADDAYVDLKVKDAIITGEFGDETNRSDPDTVLTSSLEFVLEGNAVVLTTGIAGDLQVPFDCEILEVVLLADQTGDIVVDIWKDTYANFPPTVADTITASAKPTISSGIKYQDSTLTGWTKTISAGDILRFNIDSVTDITRCTVILKVRKT